LDWRGKVGARFAAGAGVIASAAWFTDRLTRTVVAPATRLKRRRPIQFGSCTGDAAGGLVRLDQGGSNRAARKICTEPSGSDRCHQAVACQKSSEHVLAPDEDGECRCSERRTGGTVPKVCDPPCILAWRPFLAAANLPTVGAALGSCNIHCSAELGQRQRRLAQRIDLFDRRVAIAEQGNSLPIRMIAIARRRRPLPWRESRDIEARNPKATGRTKWRCRKFSA
jgi:hypothetical protein